MYSRCTCEKWGKCRAKWEVAHLEHQVGPKDAAQWVPDARGCVASILPPPVSPPGEVFHSPFPEAPLRAALGEAGFVSGMHIDPQTHQ